ncbi:MAG: hypothetical protein R3F61_21760 [Myxococcota bacterium]
MPIDPPSNDALPQEWEPHFEWLAELLSDSRSVVASLLWEPLFPLDELRRQVEAYRTLIDQAGPQADHDLGTNLADRTLRLIDTMAAGCSDLHHRMTQVTVRYFVLDDDGDDDLMSPFGFDDDVEVFNAVVARLGLPELVIDG